MSHWCNDVAPPECGYTQAGTKQVQTNRRSKGRIGWENKQPDRRRPPRPALAWRRTAGSWTRVASRGGYQVGQPLRLKVQLDQQRERSVAESHDRHTGSSIPRGIHWDTSGRLLRNVCLADSQRPADRRLHPEGHPLGCIRSVVSECVPGNNAAHRCRIK